MDDGAVGAEEEGDEGGVDVHDGEEVCGEGEGDFGEGDVESGHGVVCDGQLWTDWDRGQNRTHSSPHYSTDNPIPAPQPFSPPLHNMPAHSPRHQLSS